MKSDEMSEQERSGQQRRIKLIIRDLRQTILKLLPPSIRTLTVCLFTFLLILRIPTMRMLVLNLDMTILHRDMEWTRGETRELGRTPKPRLSISLSMQVHFFSSRCLSSLSSSSVRKWVKSENFRGLLGPLSFPLPLFLSPYSHSLERLKRSQAIRSVNLNVTGLTESLLSRSLLSPRLHLLPTPTSYRSSTDSTNLK